MSVPVDRVGHHRRVLAATLGLLLVGEMALGPYYPQLFRELYARGDPAATGVFVWTTRLCALVALPLLGLLARRVGAARVVTGGLAVAAVCDLLLPWAPTLATFTALSAVAAAAGSALLLAYPALVRLDGAGSTPGTVWFAGLFHGAVVAAAALGALIVALPEPRVGLAAFAPMTVVLLVASRRALRATPDAPAPAPATARRHALLVLATVVLLGTVLDFSIAVVRPFFVAALEGAGHGAVVSTTVFLLPSLAALAVLPVLPRVASRMGAAALPSALVLAAVGLVLQTGAQADLVPILAGRVAFGVGVVLAQIEVDRRIFAVAGTAGPGFAASETARGIGLVLAPLAAATAATHDLFLPLAVGAAGLGLAALLTAVPHMLPRPLRKAHRVPSV
ncbi:MAG: hypothetical protein AB7G37_12050 [Solirubrobacteraceae bacterium]